jgi:hypothetical protein
MMQKFHLLYESKQPSPLEGEGCLDLRTCSLDEAG